MYMLLALPIEHSFWENFIQIFGGNIILGIIAVFIFLFAIIAFMRIPIFVALPLMVSATIIVSTQLTQLTFPLIIMTGFIIATLVYSIWKGG